MVTDGGWQRAFAPENWSNWLLVTAGIGGVFAAWQTLRTIKRQTEIMARQTKGILRQSVTMRRQTKLLRKSAEAAEKSAIAAIDNINAFKNKERARVRIEPGQVNVSQGLEHVTYKVFCFGTTPAFILDSRVSARVTKSETPDDNVHSHSSTNFPPAIQPSAVADERIAFIFDLPEGDILNEIQNRKMFIHLHGTIRYRDIFETERITTFRYVYGIPGFGILLPCPPDWDKCGTPEENQET